VAPLATRRSARQPAAGPWTSKAAVAATFFLLFVLVQTLVPAALLWSPRPARFGWQMFSAKPRSFRYVLVLRDGTSQPVQLSRYLAQSRGEVAMDEALPPHLCRVVPGLAAVRVVPTAAPEGESPRVFACPR
jgi:hypothetical protein